MRSLIFILKKCYVTKAAVRTVHRGLIGVCKYNLRPPLLSSLFTLGIEVSLRQINRGQRGGGAKTEALWTLIPSEPLVFIKSTELSGASSEPRGWSRHLDLDKTRWRRYVVLHRLLFPLVDPLGGKTVPVRRVQGSFPHPFLSTAPPTHP